MTDSVPTAPLTLAAGNSLRAMAMVTGSSPRPTPCKPRPTTIIRKVADAAEMAHPATTAPSATSMTRRFIGPSASRPMIGVATAPVMRAAVSSHSAVLSDTPSARAMLGISGAPRLLTMAISMATLTRVGSVARRRQDDSGQRAGHVGAVIEAAGGTGVTVDHHIIN